MLEFFEGSVGRLRTGVATGTSIIAAGMGLPSSPSTPYDPVWDAVHLRSVPSAAQ